MKLAVVGSRAVTDKKLITETLSLICTEEGVTEIVSGGAAGVDTIAANFATESGLKLTVFLANWDKHGKSAGFIRNVDIWEYADFGIAFWDGRSKGTAHSFKLAKKYNKTLIVVDFSTGELHLEHEQEEDV